MNDTNNYFGATVFWLYIAAALYFSTIIIITIIRIGPSEDGNGSRRKQDTLIFSTLAALCNPQYQHAQCAHPVVSIMVRGTQDFSLIESQPDLDVVDHINAVPGFW
jgi:hypothetical protein